MTRREEFEKALWRLHERDSYFRDDYLKALTEFAYPEFRDYRVQHCDYCRKDYLGLDEGWQDREYDTEFPETFCSDECRIAYPNRPKSKSISTAEINKIMREGFKGIEEAMNEPVAFFSRLRMK